MFMGNKKVDLVIQSVLTVCIEYPSYKWNLPCISRTGTPFSSPNINLDLWLGAVEMGKCGISEYKNASSSTSMESPKLPSSI